VTLVLLHGFMDAPVTWDLVLPRLPAGTLAPPVEGHDVGALEAYLDERGIAAPHVVGNSAGGYLALELAERGRALSVVALAPSGGWAEGSTAPDETLAWQRRIHRTLQHVDPAAAVATEDGRRRATRWITERWEHIPPSLLAAQLRAAATTDVDAHIATALDRRWPLDPARVTCPLRIVWGLADKILPWPAAAARYRAWFPHADWVELDGVGHCPQLDVPLETAELIVGFASA
jgi:pimeloyl-ACP methyl ester carboxylesterase